MARRTDGEFRHNGMYVVAPSTSDDGLRARDDNTGCTVVAGTPAAAIQETLYRLAATRGLGNETRDDAEFKRIMDSVEAYRLVNYMLSVTLMNVRLHARTWNNIAGQGSVVRNFVEHVLKRTLNVTDESESEPDDVVRYHGATPALKPPKPTIDVELPEEDTGEST